MPVARWRAPASSRPRAGHSNEPNSPARWTISDATQVTTLKGRSGSTALIGPAGRPILRRTSKIGPKRLTAQPKSLPGSGRVPTVRGGGVTFPERALLIRVELDQLVQKRSGLIDRLHADALVQAVDMSAIGVSEDAGHSIRRNTRRV
jgi:hypothetical protein